MKYMENEKYNLFNQALSNVEIGDKVITGRIELYSCESHCIKPMNLVSHTAALLGSVWKLSSLIRILHALEPPVQGC